MIKKIVSRVNLKQDQSLTVVMNGRCESFSDGISMCAKSTGFRPLCRLEAICS